MPWRRNRYLFGHLFDQCDKFGDFLRLIGLIVRSDRFFDAMSGVNVEDLDTRLPRRRFERDDLLENIHTIAVFLHHFDNTASLPFDTSHAGYGVRKFAAFFVAHGRFSVGRDQSPKS